GCDAVASGGDLLRAADPEGGHGMTAVILWKEYRQLRTVWLAILILGIALTVTFGLLQGFATTTTFWAMTLLALIHTLLCVAVRLAGDKEAGSVVFLDMLAGSRNPLFTRKLLAGLLMAQSQCFLLALLASGIRWKEFGIAAPWLCLVSLDALIWGLLAGAL